MNTEVIKNGQVLPEEIDALRLAVGWNTLGDDYEKILKKAYAHYTVRDDHGSLIGYLAIISDGVADAFLIDLVVHPSFQRTGLGECIVRTAIYDMKQAGIHCVQVTFKDHLEPFYRKCGFHIFKGGIIDFKHMEWPHDAGPDDTPE